MKEREKSLQIKNAFLYQQTKQSEKGACYYYPMVVKKGHIAWRLEFEISGAYE